MKTKARKPRDFRTKEGMSAHCYNRNEDARIWIDIYIKDERGLNRLLRWLEKARPWLKEQGR